MYVNDAEQHDWSSDELSLIQEVARGTRTAMGRLAAEAEPAKKARELSDLLSATTDAVVALNRDWQFSYLNPSAVKRYAAGRELIGKKVWEEFPDAYYTGSPAVEAYEGAMYAKVSDSFEIFYPEPLNIWLRVSVFPTDDGIVTFSKGVTEERKTLRRCSKSRNSQPLVGLPVRSHMNINNPLESVTNLLYLAQGSTDFVEIQDYLRTAEHELGRISAITRQTLRFHKQSTDSRPVFSKDLLRTVLSIYYGRLTNSGIQVGERDRTKKAGEYLDGEIRQVLNNLVGNATDAMLPGGGRLLLRSRDSYNWRLGQHGLTMTVADTGNGMPPEIAKRVFEAFFTTKGNEGTGLGLWISHEVVDRHHGSLRLRSSQRKEQTLPGSRMSK